MKNTVKYLGILLVILLIGCKNKIREFEIDRPNEQLIIYSDSTFNLISEEHSYLGRWTGGLKDGDTLTIRRESPDFNVTYTRGTEHFKIEHQKLIRLELESAIISEIFNLNQEGKAISEALLTFAKESGEAVLIGKAIELFDNSLEPIEKPNIQEGQFLELIAKSDSLYNKTEDYCNAFHFIQVQLNAKESYLDGRHVYKLDRTLLDTVDVMTQGRIKILSTAFFGIGVADENGLTFCSNYNEPVVLIDENKAIKALIKVEKDSLFRAASWNHKFDYLELLENDGAMDSISSVSFTDEGIVLHIRRQFQEGVTDFDVLLKETSNGYTAKYLNYPALRYE